MDKTIANVLYLKDVNKVFGLTEKKVIFRYTGDLSKVPRFPIEKEIAPQASCNHKWHQKSKCSWQCEYCKGWKYSHDSSDARCVSGSCYDNLRCSGCGSMQGTRDHHHTASSATCTSGGNCNCGKNPTSPLGHNFVNGKCTRCSAVSCSHNWGSWSSWSYDGSVSHRRSRSCKKCSATESESEWCDEYVSAIPGGGATYRDSSTHLVDAMCSRCKSSNWQKIESHSYDSNNYCRCGASNSGGGGGQPPVKPSLSSLSATVRKDGMTVDISASGSNIKTYMFQLYQGPIGNNFQVDSAGPQGGSTCTFSNLLPKMEYQVKCTVLNGNLGDTGSTSFTTPDVIIPSFSWPVNPTQGSEFAKTVTKSAWDTLQAGINMRRRKYNQPLYSFTWDEQAENMFTYPQQGKAFSYKFYNQVLNALKTIPEFKYNLGANKTSQPDEWLAKEFLNIQNGMNSLK